MPQECRCFCLPHFQCTHTTKLYLYCLS